MNRNIINGWLLYFNEMIEIGKFFDVVVVKCVWIFVCKGLIIYDVF